MSRNTLSKREYTFWVFLGAIVFSTLYRKFYAVNYIGLEFTILQILMSAGLWFILMCRNRNYSSVFLSILLPLVVLETIEYWEYVPAVPKITEAAVLIALAVGIVLVRRDVGCNIGRQWWITAFKGTFLKSFGMAACLIMLIGVVHGRSVHIRQISVLYRSVLNDIEAESIAKKDEITLNNNLETLSRLDPKGGWKTLSLEEKSDVLKPFIQSICWELGMRDSFPNLNIAYLSEELLGFYDRETDTVTLSYDYIVKAKADGYSVCRVLGHELYHRMQYYQIEMLEALEASETTAKYADLQLFSGIAEYRRESENYIDGQEDYFLYATQTLERDAEIFGDKVTAECYDAVQVYFEQEQGET